MKRGSQDLEPPRVPPESGWAMGWSRAVSRAREGPASKVTATQLDTAVSLVHATQAGRELCVTSKLATPVMATSECFYASSKTTASAMALKERPRFVCPVLYLLYFPLPPYRCIHGTCIPINSYSYSCRCQPGFAGVLCDEQDQDTANPCSLSRCKHGKCRVSGLGKAYCECNSGYTGEACDRGKRNTDACSVHYLNSSKNNNLILQWASFNKV